MRKFTGLVINEYIKIICKVSTKIMIATIILVALGFNVLVYIASRSPTVHHHGWPLEERIREARQFQFSGWEEVVARYEYFIEHGIDITVPHNSPSRWRVDAGYALFSMKSNLDRAEPANEAGERINEEYVTFTFGYTIHNSTDEEALRIQINNLDQAIRNNDWLAYYRAELAHLETFLPPGDYRLWELQYKIEHEIAPGSWQNNVLNEIASAKFELSRLNPYTTNPELLAEIAELEAIVLIGEYRLAHNLRSFTHSGMGGMTTMNDATFWEIFAGSTSTIALLSVLIVIVAGSILSSEFSAGTVKFLLINPVHRWKVFAAKYIAIVTLTLAMLALLFIFNALFAGIFFGFRDITAPFLSTSNGRIVTGSSFGFIASRYLLGVIGTVVIGTFAFAVSSLVKSSALAIGLGVFLYFSGWMAVQLLGALGVYQAKFILFANTNILSVINGATGFVNHTLTFAIINIAIYMFVFLLTAWDGFVRGDIK